MKIVYACLISMIFTFPFVGLEPIFAQDQSSGEEHQPPSADEIVAKMQSKLNLTSDQVTAITPIIEKYASQREELMQSVEDGTADRDSIRSQMKQLRDSEKQDLSQVLSGDQISQWEKMQGQGRHRHSDGQSQTDGSGGTGSGGEGSNSGEN